ncbi:hypothetical protein HID58_061543 [Brassica napus]|uniref:Secreted protein n=1 Tax=Brassica napus TaxID=3708 RepID=A0ABQ7ZYV6_BRANA|nr:hypothetical protein HID58_061543 [Brassica napus]
MMIRRILIYRRALLELLCQEVQVYHVVQRRLWNGTLLGHRTLTCRVVRLLEFMLQLMRKIKPKVPVLRSYRQRKLQKALFED